MSQLLADTLDKERYFREYGYRVEVVWECEWERGVDSRPDIKAFLRVFFRSAYPRRPLADMARLVERIRSGEFYELVECNIRIPPALEVKFAETGPIFKNVSISRDQLGEKMV